MRQKKQKITVDNLYTLSLGTNLRFFAGESFAFWMVCLYLFFEYVRPQSIYPAIDFLPWNKLFVLGAIVGCFFDKSVRWVRSSVNVLLIFYLLWVLLSSLLAYFPETSYENLSNYYLWVIIYFIIINIVNTRERLFVFVSIFLLASFKISLSLALTWAARGFSFTKWGLMGPAGFFENSGELAIQMLVFWPLAWAFAHAVKPSVGKLWYLILMLMPITAIMVILGASSRGAQVALVCQLVVMNYRFIFRPKVLIAIAVSFFLIWTFLPDQQKERFESIGQDRTSKQRVVYFLNGVEMIKEHPVLGVGFFNFAPYFERNYPEDVLFKKAQLPHNIFIQVGTDAGIVGLIIFLSLIYIAYSKAKKFQSPCGKERINLIGLCSNLSLLGFVIAGQFVTVAYYPFLWIHLALVVSLNNILSQDQRERKKKQVRRVGTPAMTGHGDRDVGLISGMSSSSSYRDR